MATRTSSTFPRSCADPVYLEGATVVWTGRADGDFAMAPGRAETALARLTALAGRPVSWLSQVHGNGVAVVSPAHPAAGRGEQGDALVTATDSALAVMTADCAPVALSSPEGVVAAVHAGWRGVVAGVLQEAVAVMRMQGAGRISAALGPCIRAECYAFDGAALDRVVARVGASVRSERADGTPALDLPAAVAVALEEAGADLVVDVGECTACAGDRYFSHRARGETARQAMVVWKS